MAKFKIKNKKSASKRFSIKSSGKIKRGKANTSHILTKMSRKRKNKLKKAGYVTKADSVLVLKCMPNG